MSANQITVPFEGRDIVLDLPESWEVIAELRPNPMSGLDDIQGALIHELINPIGCGSLASFGLKDKRVVIVVDDISRPTPLHLFFGELLKYLLSNGTRKEKHPDYYRARRAPQHDTRGA